MTPEQIAWLTWGAIQHRPSGAPKWDEPGTAKAIADHCGSWGLSIATEHVLAHARDPKAKTPFVIKGPTPHTEPVKGARFPAKVGTDCHAHPGEHADGCRACAADALAGDGAQVIPLHRTKPPAEVAQIGAAACRAAMGLPERTPDPSPAPDVASVPAVDEAAAHPGREPQDVQQRAGEPDRPETACPDCEHTHTPNGCTGEPSPSDRWAGVSPSACDCDTRPETACAAEGCYRPTRDGICDRCREKAAAEDLDAANTELVNQLKTQQRARAHGRPPADPGPPRYFTGADINHDRVHAAQARAATERSNA